MYMKQHGIHTAFLCTNRLMTHIHTYIQEYYDYVVRNAEGDAEKRNIKKS